MSRLASTIRKDMIVQSRNNIYTMTLVVALLFAIVFSILLKPEHIGVIIPAAMLFIVGGTTVVFIAILIMDEKELGLLNAMTVTPLSTKEYLIAKVGSITFLASLEVAIMLGVPIVLGYYRVGIQLPNFVFLVLGVIIVNLMYSLLGVGLIVRFEKFTEFMFPAVMIMVFFQIPAIYYAGILSTKAILLIPSAAPVMLIYGSFNQLEVWQLIYGIGYSVIILAGFAFWAYRAYVKHVVRTLS